MIELDWLSLPKGPPKQQRVVARVLDVLQGTHQQRLGLSGACGAAAEERLGARTE